MIAVRFWTWIICVLAAVHLSTYDTFVHLIRQLLESHNFATWTVLLPVSLTASWLAAQMVLYFIGLPKVSSDGKAIFITGEKGQLECDTKSLV